MVSAPHQVGPCTAYGRESAKQQSVHPQATGPEGKIDLRVHILGPFAVYPTEQDVEVTPRGRKARAILCFLICHAGSKISKTRLAELLWGDRAEKQARASLRQALLELRRALNSSGEIIASDREHVWIPPDSVEETINPVAGWQDVFEDLDGVTAEFDVWLAFERARRRTAHIARLKADAEELLKSGRAEESLLLIDAIHEIDGFDEDALRLGMQANFHLGRSAAILERYQRAESLLEEGLGVRPSNQSRTLRDRLIGRLTQKGGNARHETDKEYFSRRARAEREAASRAKEATARHAHEELARRYEDMVDAVR